MPQRNDNQTRHFWCFNIRFNGFRKCFDAWYSLHKFDVESAFHIVRINSHIFQYFCKIVVCKFAFCYKFISSFVSALYASLVFSVWDGKAYFVETTVDSAVARIRDLTKTYYCTERKFRPCSLLCGQCVKLINLVKANVKQIVFLNCQICWLAVFPLRKFCTEQMFVLVCMQLRNHTDTKSVKHFKQ